MGLIIIRPIQMTYQFYVVRFYILNLINGI
jgi:hypothetical protein